MKFIDLFAGLGGFHLAASQIDGECVFASEINPTLQDIYEANFGMRPAGDIRQVSLNAIPAHDLLCAGFPCQPFSKAGNQIGWEDAVRGTLFYDIINILRQCTPEFLILENVAHFVLHDDGNTYRRVKEALEALGYEIQAQKLSPHQFGVPQIRERMYMVGRLKALGGLGDLKWPHPQTKASELLLQKSLDEHPPEAKSLSKQVIKCLGVWQEFIQKYPTDKQLPSFPIWSMEFGADYPYDFDSLYEVEVSQLKTHLGSFGATLNLDSMQDILSNVPNYARKKEGVFPKWKQRFIKQNRELYTQNQSWIDSWLPKISEFPQSLQKFEWNCKGEKRDIWEYVIQFRASGVRIKRPTTSPSLVAMTTTQIPIIAWEKRYMTIKEAARIQSMEALEHFPNTETSAWAALGNAVNVKVVNLILVELLKLKKFRITGTKKTP